LEKSDLELSERVALRECAVKHRGFGNT
jgi:hypothetical protein